MKVQNLKPWDRNPRRITDEKLNQLQKSMIEFGDLSGIVYNRTTERLVGGHQRTKMLPPDAEVIVDRTYDTPTKVGTVAEGYVLLDGERFTYREVVWDEIRETAANLAANTHGGEFDKALLAEHVLFLDQNNVDMDLIGMNSVELEELMAPIYPEWNNDPRDETQDEVPEVKNTDIKLGDLFQLGEHRLLCGDSTDKAQVDRLMNGSRADMVFTDPPYGIDIQADYGNRMKGSSRSSIGDRAVKVYKQIEGDNKAFDPSMILECFADSKIFLWGANNYANNLPRGDWLVWYKKTNDQMKKMFGWDFELCWTNQKAGQVYEHAWAGVLGHNKELDGATKTHPTMKSVSLIIKVFQDYESTVVWDGFLGSGSTLIACEKTNRKCYGMEIDPQYCQVIIDRFEKFTGKKAVKVSE